MQGVGWIVHAISKSCCRYLFGESYCAIVAAQWKTETIDEKCWCILKYVIPDQYIFYREDNQNKSDHLRYK